MHKIQQVDKKIYIKSILLLAGLFIILHSAIPHDHHYNGEVHLHHSHSHHSHADAHCFLVNNLSSAKFVVDITSPVVNALFDLPKVENNHQGFIQSIEYLLVKVILHKKTDFIKSLPVRGSPF